MGAVWDGIVGDGGEWWGRVCGGFYCVWTLWRNEL